MERPVIYLDTSVIVPLFLSEPRSRDSERVCASDAIIVSELATAELSSALGLAVRSKRLPGDVAQSILSLFDAWMPVHAAAAEVLGDDFAVATVLLRRFDLALRTPDALHLAIASRLGATLATFDRRMAVAARALGVGAIP
jgi:hypothetical protein